MSIIEGCERLSLTEFGGTRSLIDAIDLEPSDALVALNCRFNPGRVRTREGFAVLYQDLFPSLVKGSLFYFRAALSPYPSDDYLAYLTSDLINDSLVVKDLTTGIHGAAILTTGNANGTYSQAIWSQFGNRLYAALIQYDASYLSPTGSPYVWDGNIAAPNAISCFQRPMLTTEVTEALTQPGAGVVSAGNHYVGVLFQTKSGYWTRPGPADTSLVLQPQVIASTGANNIRVTLTPATTWPAWIKAVQVVMTTAQNSFQYYVVAGTITSVTAGGATPVVVDVNISDEHLASTGSQGAGTLADGYFNLLCMNSSNVQPFNVKFVLPWGQRLVWCATYGGVDTLFISEQQNGEWITADQHSQTLPGQKPIGSAFVQRGILYVVSSAGGLYGFVDNGGTPVTFSPPSTIDGSVSAPNFSCASTSASGGFSLILGPTGVYVFSGGALSPLPLSYNQLTEWQNLQWQPNVTYRYAAKDFPQERLIIVYVVGNGGAVGVGRILTWSYENGLTPDKAKFCEWTNPSASDGFNVLTPGPSIEIVRKTGIWQLVLSAVATVTGQTTTALMRMQSTNAGDSASNLYKDFLGTSFSAVGIDWRYQTAPLPKLGDAPMLQHLAGRVRAKALTGTPALYLSAKSLDDTRTITIARSPITLSTSPGTEYLYLFDAQEERISHLFTNNSVAGAGISIAALTHFYNFFSEQR